MSISHREPNGLTGEVGLDTNLRERTVVQMQEIGRKRLQVPRVIAVVGASPVGSGNYYGARLLANVISAGPDATVFPVNPRYANTEVQGLAAYGRLSDLPTVPDLVLLVTPVRLIPDILREAGALGVATAVVISAEFGDERARKALDETVADIGRTTGMRIIGPNSMGVLNGVGALNASFSSATYDGGLRPGPVAVLGQSGAALTYFLQVNRDQRLGYSWLISTGNEAATTLEELFEDVVVDEATSVIMMFVEGVSDGTRFRRAAYAARSLGKPVLMLKAGASESGREAVQSHTGRIAGADHIFTAVAEETGIVRVGSYQELFDCARSLAELGAPNRDAPHGRRAVVIGTSGGAVTLIADHLSAAGWTLPKLPAPVREKLEAESCQKGLGNPIDITGTFADVTLMPRMLRVISTYSDVDAVFVVTGAGGAPAETVATEIAAVAPAIGHEIYVAWVGMPPEVARALDRPGICAYPDPLRAVAAAEASAQFRCSQTQYRQDGRPSAPPAIGVQQRSVERNGLWTAAETLCYVDAAGVRCAPFTVSTGLDPEEVAGLAGQIGYPVVLKLDSRSLNHKSDQGGVKLGLADRAAVIDATGAFREIAARDGLARPRVLVQAMIRGIEILVGVKRDPAFGPVLLLGSGGTLAELRHDALAVVLPASRRDLDRMLWRHTTLSRLIAGYRGAPPADRDSLVDVLEHISEWALARGDSLMEADFNPVMVSEEGAFVVDARAVFE